jgi:hypothetical protein
LGLPFLLNLSSLSFFMELPEDREKLKKRLEVLSGGAARVSQDEAKETQAKHKSVLIAKKPETVVDRLRAIAARGRKKISRALKGRKNPVKRKKARNSPSLKKPRKQPKRHRMP